MVRGAPSVEGPGSAGAGDGLGRRRGGRCGRCPRPRGDNSHQRGEHVQSLRLVVRRRLDVRRASAAACRGTTIDDAGRSKVSFQSFTREGSDAIATGRPARVASRILRDSAPTFLAELAIGVAILVNGVVIARGTGTNGKGVFTLVVAGGQLGAALFGLRWDRSVGHFLARDRRNLNTVVWSGALVAAGSLLLAWLVSHLVP